MNKLPKVSRVEVINHAVAEDNPDYGRAYVYWPDEPIEVSYDLQDDEKTLKVFIEKKTMNNEHCKKCLDCDYDNDGGKVSFCQDENCSCHVAPKTTLQQLQEEGRKEFDFKFPKSKALDGQVWRSDTQKISSRRSEIHSFQDHLIEKAFTAGKEEAVDYILSKLPEPTEHAPHIEPIRKLIDSARTNNSLD